VAMNFFSFIGMVAAFGPWIMECGWEKAGLIRYWFCARSAVDMWSLISMYHCGILPCIGFPMIVLTCVHPNIWCPEGFVSCAR
jgi:hypothetical protein